MGTRPVAVHWMLALLGILIVMPGCLNLDPRGNPTEYYVLDGGAWSEGEDTAAGLSVGLRQLRLPSYLETPRMVVREGTHGVRFAEYHRWGEDLGRSINRVVAGYLTASANVQRVDVVPWPPWTSHDYTVEIRVLRFEGVVPDAAEGDGQAAPESHVRMMASWEILDPGQAVLASGTTDYLREGWPVDDYDALASMLDAGLQVLSEDLAARLATLSGQ